MLIDNINKSNIHNEYYFTINISIERTVDI